MVEESLPTPSHITKRRWTQLLKLVAPKFKGKPPASCPHNFLVHICQEHEDVGDVERVVRGLADRSVSARDYRKHVPPGSKPTAQSAQDESDAPSLAPSDSKTVTGSSFIRQQDTEDSGTSSSAAGPAPEDSGPLAEGGGTDEASASQEQGSEGPSEAGSSVGSSDVEDSDSEGDSSLGLGDGLDPDDHDFALNESDVVDSD